MYIPDLPTYLVFYFETTRGSSIDTLTTDSNDDNTLLIFSSIQTGDTTAIGGKEFKPFDNLTTRWIKTSKLSQLLWVICIDDDGERKLPMEAHKIYANKIAHGLIS
jgi:hypothetical protein